MNIYVWIYLAAGVVFAAIVYGMYTEVAADLPDIKWSSPWRLLLAMAGVVLLWPVIIAVVIGKTLGRMMQGEGE